MPSYCFYQHLTPLTSKVNYEFQGFVWDAPTEYLGRLSSATIWSFSPTWCSGIDLLRWICMFCGMLSRLSSFPSPPFKKSLRTDQEGAEADLSWENTKAAAPPTVLRIDLNEKHSGYWHQIKNPQTDPCQLGDLPSLQVTSGFGRSSDSWIFLLPAPSHVVSSCGLTTQWFFAGFVPRHSGGSMPESHRLPF